MRKILFFLLLFCLNANAQVIFDTKETTNIYGEKLIRSVNMVFTITNDYLTIKEDGISKRYYIVEDPTIEDFSDEYTAFYIVLKESDLYKYSALKRTDYIAASEFLLMYGCSFYYNRTTYSNGKSVDRIYLSVTENNVKTIYTKNYYD